MNQLFSKRADIIFRVLLGTVATAAIGFWPVRSVFEHSSYSTYVGQYIEQPVPFSHKHHVGDLGLDCRYCHTSVTKAASAGYPPTATCMGCHSQVWKDAPVLAPVRSSFATGTPLVWNRVYNLPDYVYFNHRIHVSKGFACETCHGRVDTMPLTSKANAFHMEDCLDCHRHPERYVRPVERVFDMGFKADQNDKLKIGIQLLRDNHIHTTGIEDCATCHR